MAADKAPQVSALLPMQAVIISLSTAQLGGWCPEEVGMMLKGSWARGANWMCSDQGEVCHGEGLPGKGEQLLWWVAAAIWHKINSSPPNPQITPSTAVLLLWCHQMSLLQGAWIFVVRSWDRHWIYEDSSNRGRSWGHQWHPCLASSS